MSIISGQKKTFYFFFFFYFTNVFKTLWKEWINTIKQLKSNKYFVNRYFSRNIEGYCKSNIHFLFFMIKKKLKLVEYPCMDWKVRNSYLAEFLLHLIFLLRVCENSREQASHLKNTFPISFFFSIVFSFFVIFPYSIRFFFVIDHFLINIMLNEYLGFKVSGFYLFFQIYVFDRNLFIKRLLTRSWKV